VDLGWIKPRALIRRKAAELLVRVDCDPSLENAERLERWRSSSPRHREALRSAEAVLMASRLLSHSPAGAPRLAAGPTGPSRLALAASIAAALVVIPALLLFERQRTSIPLQAMMLSTPVGKIRAVPLADGSTVTLDTASSVRIEIARTGRSATLERGRARFLVTRRNVPFTVRVGSAVVSMDEGMVDVARIGGDPSLELIAGAARVLVPDGAGSPRRVEAPVAIRHLATDGQRVYRRAGPAADWTTGRLTFDDARMSEVIAAANRYSRIQILIGDPNVGQLRVTGVYRTGDAVGLARTLASAFSLEVRPDPSGNLRLERSSSGP
jgi:transmembrane sensor